MAKRVLTLILAALNLTLVVLGIDELKHSNDAGFYLRFFFYCVETFSWLISFALVAFEYSRRLEMSWLGQRFYWPISFIMTLSHVTFQSYQIIANKTNSSYEIAWAKVSLYLLCAIVSGTLAWIAIFRPNDFYLINRNDCSYTTK
jgi:hypothetical protein